MKQFPITLSDTIKSTHSSFYPEHALPLFDYGKKLYIEYEGKIRAAIPLYTAFVTVPGGAYGRRTTNLTGFNIAGIGKKDIECDMHFSGHELKTGHSFPRLFKTLEDYDRFIENKGGAYRPDAVSVPDILRVNGYSVFCEVETWQKGIVGYFYHHNDVIKGTMPFCDMFVDADGAHVTVLHRGTGWAEDKVAYLTREECLAANRKDVVDFEEEVVETKPPVKRLDHDSALICESIQEVTLVCWPMIYGENNDHDLDSREILDLFRAWGEEFESWWINHDEEWICEHDYIAEVEHFAEQKATAYLESLK